MQTPAEERINASAALRKLEDSAQLLQNLASDKAAPDLSAKIPETISSVLNTLTTVSSRDDAERLLATGVGMWNSVISLEDRLAASAGVTLAKIRHVAADCIYMSITVLGGISARFDIDDVSLLKFYTSCGRKYASDAEDMAMAAICFAKAEEFAKSAKASPASTRGGSRPLAKALFDLAIGSAECAWEQDEHARAGECVAYAREFLGELPEECEFLASILYNFGLYAYQSKDLDQATSWLEMSLETRSTDGNPTVNLEKQAKTLRLMGLCRIAKKEFPHALDTLKQAEATNHDPVGAYLLLKLSIITGADGVAELLHRTLDDPSANLDICMGSIALVQDAQRLAEAISGFEKVFQRHEADTKAICTVIGPRYVEALCASEHVEEGCRVLQTCCTALSTWSPQLDTEGPAERPGTLEMDESIVMKAFICLSCVALHAATALAERQKYGDSLRLLELCLQIAGKAQSCTKPSTEGDGAIAMCDTPAMHGVAHEQNVVLHNECSVRRLAASCALSEIMRTKSSMEAGTTGGRLNGTTAEGSNQLVDAALSHAIRAKELEKDDFSSRLLLFRAYLASGEIGKAAKEMEYASQEIHAFDAGVLAEAACDANDSGSAAAVMAVLRCILQAHIPKKETTKQPEQPVGLLGTVIVTGTTLLTSKQTELENLDINRNVSQEQDPAQMDRSQCDLLLRFLTDGVKALSSNSKSTAFEDDSRAEAALEYLSNVAWNHGRSAGLKGRHREWGCFFDLCYDLCSLREQSYDVIVVKRMARVMVRMIYRTLAEEHRPG